MKLVSFFVLSLSLHGAALVYPVSFAGRIPADLMPVTLVSIDHEPPGGGGGGSGNPAEKAGSKLRRATPAIEAKTEAKPQNSPALQAIFAEAVEKDDESIVALISDSMDWAESVGSETSDAASSAIDGAGSGGGDGSGNSFGFSGTGFGFGMGNGPGSSGSGIVPTQARYRDTPKPNYPDSARREGREGKVLLRVFVDEQGRSKKVEIHSSSGSDALDRAAVEAIQRWRFHPARIGDKPVESWLRIPIEFRLADAQSW